MAKRQFTISHFVQNLNIELLEAYFKQAGINFPDNLKITEDDKKPNADAIETYIGSLDVTQQEKIINDFIEINELSYEGGILTILDVGNTYKIALLDEVSTLIGYNNQSLFCFLNYKDTFQLAMQFAHFDNLSTKTVKYGLLKKSQEEVNNNEIKADLEAELKVYFKQKEGRGQNCNIQITTYKDRVFYRALPQNYSQFVFEYDLSGKLNRNLVNPVFEVIFIYYPSEGKIELSCNFRNKRRKELIDIFNKVVLKDDKNLEDGLQTYDFNRIVADDFVMPLKSEDKVSWAYLKQIRFSYKYISARKIILEVDDKNTDGAKALHEMIKEHRLQLDQLNVTQATCKIKFEGAGNKGSVTTVITFPDKCNLSDTPTHQKAKEYLKYWKLELNDEAENN